MKEVIEVNVKCGLCGYECGSGKEMAQHYVIVHPEQWNSALRKERQAFAYAATEEEDWN